MTSAPIPTCCDPCPGNNQAIVMGGPHTTSHAQPNVLPQRAPEKTSPTLLRYGPAGPPPLYMRTSALPQLTPAPSAHMSTMSFALILPARTFSSSRMGIDALDVLPTRSMFESTFSFG